MRNKFDSFFLLNVCDDNNKKKKSNFVRLVPRRPQYYIIYTTRKQTRVLANWMSRIGTQDALPVRKKHSTAAERFFDALPIFLYSSHPVNPLRKQQLEHFMSRERNFRSLSPFNLFPNDVGGGARNHHAPVIQRPQQVARPSGYTKWPCLDK